MIARHADIWLVLLIINLGAFTLAYIYRPLPKHRRTK